MDLKNERLMMSEEEVRNRVKELLNENQEDLIIKYMFLEQQCKKQKEVIDKAIEYIEKEYYSKNTVDIENMGITTNKLLQVRKFLKEVSE